MRAIARNTARCTALLCILAAFARADAHDDVMEVFTSMAAALTEVNGDGDKTVYGNVSKFMSAVSKDMPDYDTLKANVAGLVNNVEISSVVQPIEETDQGETYKIDLDWAMDIRSLEQDGPLVRRREILHCELRKEKKHWKVIALKPLDFFAAANLGN
jgi:hypothetical protein